MTKILSSLKDPRAVNTEFAFYISFLLPFLFNNLLVSHINEKLKLADCHTIVLSPNNNLLSLPHQRK